MDQTGELDVKLPWRVLERVGAIRCDPAPTAVRSNSKDDSDVRTRQGPLVWRQLCITKWGGLVAMSYE
jgi:hypothetical protein